MAEPVPIRPDVELRSERAVQLLEHVVAKMTAYEADGDHAASIVFVITGQNGTTLPGWLLHDDTHLRAALAHAGAILSHEAVT